MAAAESDKYQKVAIGTATTLSAPGKALAATSITVGSTANFPTTTGITFAIRVVDGNGELVAGTYTEWVGTVSSGTTLAMNAVPVYGSDQVYTAGSTTQVYVPLSSYSYNKHIDADLVHADQDGTLKAGAVDVTAVIADGIITRAKLATAVTTEMNTDWKPGLLPAVNSVTENGNRSADITFASTVASILTPGMRIRTSRTVAAPTQSTSLNGTTQYYSKTTPNKLTFTDDFVVSAWVKVTAYQNSIIVSRYNGTSGWYLNMQADGTVLFNGLNAGAANFSYVKSYQSLPLNRWVHVTAQLDMSAFTATTTTSYIMFDGKDIPATVVRGGTNPTALVQAGNLEIGSFNGGTILFSGKIAQVAIYNAKVTQANINLTYSQGLTGSETSLASAYSFNNAITDLNTTTPNDLTANGSAVATNAASPFCTDANGVAAGTYDWAIVTKVNAAVATVQYPEGCAIPTSGGISTVDYSGVKSPFGFPVKPVGKIDCILQASFTSTATPTVTDISGASITYTATGYETLRFRLEPLYISGTAAATTSLSIYIRDGTTTIGQKLQTLFITPSNMNSALTLEFNPTAGAHTFVGSMSQSGAGTMGFVGGVNTPAVFTMEVLGLN